MTLTQEAPATYDAFRRVLSDRFDGLSPQLRLVAEFIVQHPNRAALETVAELSLAANVRPPTMVRFAQALGFTGFTDMQRVLRARLVARTPTYKERITEAADKAPKEPVGVLSDFIASSREALSILESEVTADDMRRAVEMLSTAERVHVMGMRRSFPVATYLAYNLTGFGVPAHIIDGTGGMALQQTQMIGARDLLVVISYPPYAPEVTDALTAVAAAGRPIIAITDGPLSPLAAKSDLCFETDSQETHGFRLISGAMCLCQALVVSLGLKLTEKNSQA
ncbi:MAG: MurR/RpiR family transcriptional regulator [Alphaproteobacteria bacterium]|nr:MurR/RpiR family transcriptional regulator [Alphaproteobacteria bacterium]